MSQQCRHKQKLMNVLVQNSMPVRRPKLDNGFNTKMHHCLSIEFKLASWMSRQYGLTQINNNQ